MKTRTAYVIITQVRAAARVLGQVTAEVLVRRIIIRSRYTQNRYIRNQYTMSRSTMIRAIMGTRVTAAEAITVRAMAAAAMAEAMAEAIMGADTDAAVSQWYRVKEGAAAVMAAALFAVL